MSELTETAFAKINLALHIRRRRDDGYHDIETLFAFVDDGDRLDVSPAEVLSLCILGPFASAITPDPDNLVIRAASKMQHAFNIELGAAFTLYKRLPVAAGVGGGSADAAAAIRLLTKLWSIDLHDPAIVNIAKELGADVPACIDSRTVMGSGSGAELSEISELDLTGLPILLVNPLLPCPTGPVFAGWDGVDNGTLDTANWREGRNDLTPAALALVPEISNVLNILTAQQGASLVRMSGSGATCFALFDDVSHAKMAEASVKNMRPDWWILAGLLR